MAPPERKLPPENPVVEKPDGFFETKSCIIRKSDNSLRSTSSTDFGEKNRWLGISKQSPERTNKEADAVV